MEKIARLAIKKTLKRKKKWTKKLSPSLQASDTEEDFYSSTHSNETKCIFVHLQLGDHIFCFWNICHCHF